MIARLTNRWWAVGLGALIAVDPSLLSLECYALSETLAVAMFVFCIALLLVPRRQSLLIGAILGASLGFLCLVRPAFQITVPFLALAWLITVRTNPRRTALSAVLLALGFLSTTGSWLLHNYRAGILGLSSSNAVIFWVGVNQTGLLADDFPLPEKVRRDYDTLVRPNPSDDSKALQFVVMQNAWQSQESRDLLARWALYSVRASPVAYARTTLAALGWQLQFFPRAGRITHDELGWLMWRLTADGLKLGSPHPNFSIEGNPENTGIFAMSPGRGPLAAYFKWWSRSPVAPIPRILMLLTALAATLFALLRRNWPLALILLATLAYCAAHAIFLLCVSRYSLPCWAVWYITPPLAAAAIVKWRSSSGPTQTAHLSAPSESA